MTPLALRAMCTSVTGRYAWAVFSVAKERGALEATARDFQSALELFSERSSCRFLVTRALKGAYPEAWTRQLEGSLDFQDFFLKFLQLLAQRQRLSRLKEIEKLYKRLMYAELGQVPVRVLSVVPLTEAQKEALCRRLKEIFQKDLLISYECDPRVLGGFIVESETLTIDVSARHQVEAMIGGIRQNFAKTQSRRSP